MNTNTGEIASLQYFKESGVYEHLVKPINPANLTPKIRQQVEATGRAQISRNSPCPCGSRKRFKRCCMTPRQK